MVTLSFPQQADFEQAPRIVVFGVGGAGGNAVNNMIRSNLTGVDFVVANTDAQALRGSLTENRIQLGSTLTCGLGAGTRPDIGRAAAEEAIDDIISALDGANMAFITAGMGGGTGTGAAPVIARQARDMGILTVGVVTKPFQFEGGHRLRLAETGIAELQQFVDTLIIIPNQNLFRIANEKTSFANAFKMADDVLHSGVRGVTDLMVMPGMMNLDFADIRTVMGEMGKAMMGTGEGAGEQRATDAAEAAISNPLLDDVSMSGASGVLINVTAGDDLTLYEIDEAVNHICKGVDPDAVIKFGSTFDPNLEGRIRISVVATGIDAVSARQQPPLSVVSGGRTAAPQPPLLRPQTSPVPQATTSATAQVRADGLVPAGVGLHTQSPSSPQAMSVHMAGDPMRQALDAHHTTAESRLRQQHIPGTDMRAATTSDPGMRVSGPGVHRPVDTGGRTAAKETPKQPPQRSGLKNLLHQMTSSSVRSTTAGPVPEAPVATTRTETQRATTHQERQMPASQTASRYATQGHNLGGGQGDDDGLDIPAFLRRQAN